MKYSGDVGQASTPDLKQKAGILSKDGTSSLFLETMAHTPRRCKCIFFYESQNERIPWHCLS